MIKIVQVHNRFFIEINGDRLHILNRRSLEWNLKKVFKLSPTVVAGIWVALNSNGRCEVALASNKAA